MPSHMVLQKGGAFAEVLLFFYVICEHEYFGFPEGEPSEFPYADCGPA